MYLEARKLYQPTRTTAAVALASSGANQQRW